MDGQVDILEERHSESSSEDLDSLVKVMKLTQERIDLIWNRVQNLPYIFNDFNRGDKNQFVGIFLRPDTIAYEVGDYGIIYFTDVLPPVNACGHILFWDRSFKDRSNVGKYIARKVFNEFGVHRITSIIPVFNRAAVLFAKKIGFKVEGVNREVVFSLGKWHDTVMLSLLERDLDGVNVGVDIRTGTAESDVAARS
jgi:hypothetical protein